MKLTIDPTGLVSLSDGTILWKHSTEEELWSDLPLGECYVSPRGHVSMNLSHLPIFPHKAKVHPRNRFSGTLLCQTEGLKYLDNESNSLPRSYREAIAPLSYPWYNYIHLRLTRIVSAIRLYNHHVTGLYFVFARLHKVPRLGFLNFRTFSTSIFL